MWHHHVLLLFSFFPLPLYLKWKSIINYKRIVLEITLNQTKFCLNVFVYLLLLCDAKYLINIVRKCTFIKTIKQQIQFAVNQMAKAIISVTYVCVQVKF